MTRKPSILVVDDDPTFLEIVSLQLRNQQFDVVTARGGEDGLKKAEELLPDVAVSDIVMEPGPNGWEFARALKRNPRTQGIKVVFLTSLGDPWRDLPEDREALTREIGAIEIFDKCESMDILGKKLASSLS